jgi:hypothetical protein
MKLVELDFNSGGEWKRSASPTSFLLGCQAGGSDGSMWEPWTLITREDCRSAQD